jgi:uncharacterized protein YdeI (YjbR/CyaY-like superfamily)
MITDPKDYFAKGCGRCERFATPECSTRRWLSGLQQLRRICKDAGLEETAKWGHPCYMHAGRNIVLIGAFRENFQLNFMNAALMKDPKGLLEKQGPNTRHANVLRFTDTAAVSKQEKVILAYLKEAMSYAKDGIIPPKEKAGIELPAELVDALDADDELGDAFRNLTPGRQKSYVINLGTTKNPATRIARIVKFRDKILAGKGATDR